MIDTTHVGSLPRGPELVPLLLARDKGEPYDAEEFDQVVQAAVDNAVRMQVEAGVTVVSDGELGKVGYSTYIIERLSGFGGHTPRKPAMDLAQVPDLAKKLAAIMGAQEFTRASAIGKVELVNLQPLHDDIRRFGNALADHGRDASGKTARAFLNTASPGLITAFQPNQYYPSHEAYLADLVTAMSPEYHAIVDAGFQVQFDCPDLAMSRHTGYQDMTEEQFLATILFEHANPRHEHEWKVWRDAAERGALDGKILAPGFIDSCSNYIETAELIAQRIERFAQFVGKDRVIASSDCGFGTFAGYGKIDPMVAWKKLAALRQGADIAEQRMD